MDINEKIHIVEQLINDELDFSFGSSFSRIYPFATENISAYMSLFNLENKKLLTVGSSSDQVFNAILCGCKEIDVFDLCPFSQEYFDLKRAAVEVLTREEFFSFFCYRNYPYRFNYNDRVFSTEYYFKIREVLKYINYETFCFWDKLFAKYGSLEVRKNLFTIDETFFDVIVKINKYLSNDDEYLKLRNMLSDALVRFDVGNIFDIELTKNYDNIFLSNIASYNSIKKMKEFFDILLPYLNDDGKILIAYLYQNVIDMEFDKRWILFEDADISSFIGVRGIINDNDEIKDSVVVYKKLKK